jgi:hypothetical protein
MHVVSKHTLKRRGLRRHLWDVANGVPGCYRIHRRHDLAVEKIPRTLLPARCIEWAERHGVLDALERHWPGTPFDEASSRRGTMIRRSSLALRRSFVTVSGADGGCVRRGVRMSMSLTPLGTSVVAAVREMLSDYETAEAA